MSTFTLVDADAADPFNTLIISSKCLTNYLVSGKTCHYQKSNCKMHRSFLLKVSLFVASNHQESVLPDDEANNYESLDEDMTLPNIYVISHDKNME